MDTMPFFQRIPPAVIPSRPGTGKITRNPFLAQCGTHAAVRTRDHEFIFNLNGEIRFIRGLGTDWHHPSEQLKRTDGNDWVHYAVGDDSTENGIISWMGEYYLPCLPYPSNAVWEIDYMRDPVVMGALAAWSMLFADLWDMAQKNTLPSAAMDLVRQILAHDDQVLFNRGKALKAIINTEISVLPPDTRHVDYDLIPIMVSDGCRYHCRFCCVKSRDRFRPRERKEILDQILRLKTFYGGNLVNYNALFLGNHDALAAGSDLIRFAAETAYETFGFGHERVHAPRLFLFGSADAFLEAPPSLFRMLAGLPFDTFLNIGLESPDGPTLGAIGKPLTPEKVKSAFEKALGLNRESPRLEITCNFLMGSDLPEAHYEGLVALLSGAPASNRGCVYLSPVKDSPKKRELLPLFRKIKRQSRLPVFIYLIQRF